MGNVKCGAEYVSSVGNAPAEVLRTIVIMQTRILDAGHDVQAIMQTVVDSACELLGVEGAVVELVQGAELVYRAVSGHGFETCLGYRLKVEKSFSGLCLELGRTMVSEDCANDPRVNSAASRQLGMGGMLVIPLVGPRAKLGVLKFVSRTPGPFPEIHTKVTDLLAGFIVRAINEAEEAEAHHRRFESLANSLPNLAWIADHQGEVFWFNERWYEYTGLKPEQACHGGWERVHDPRELPQALELWGRAIASGEPVEMIIKIRRKDGALRYFLTRAVPIRDNAGEVSHWFGTNTDVHNQHAAALEMQLARDEAERASRLKTAFLANMSHEIRTPLGVMIGFADLLGDPDIDGDEKTKYVGILKRNGEQLGRLINDILDLSKVESGMVDFEYRGINPSQIAREVVALMSVRAQGKKLKLHFDEDSNCPTRLVTDSGRLRQILINLVDNAIKFTEFGSVVVRLSGCTGRGGVCSFEVSDTGIGIADQSAERLFHMFNQADNSMTRKYGGTGLGLALARSLARAMGGDIELARSQPGVGSTFVFSVPSHEGAPEGPRARVDGLSMEQANG